ncbi:MAG: rod shape-determining protein RodA [Clostridia bacterium]|nr:rod shape-determining protein RodA [Clostridia bacterium]
MYGYRRNSNDKILIFAAIIAALYGLLLVSSATRSLGSKSLIIVQCAAIVIGLGVMVFLTKTDYSLFLELSSVVFGIYVFLLIIVLVIGTGRSETGTMGWISLGPVNIQPSEFAKIGFIITFAYHLERVGNKINKLKSIVMLGLHALVPLMLILMQPDYGTAMVFIFIAVAMLFCAGLKIRYFVGAISLFAASTPLLWHFILDEYQKNRILVFLNPEMSPMGSGYNVIQSKLAVGAGQFLGKGLFKGTQIQLGFLPGKHTDFIFAVAGEELGFLGCIVIIALLATIIFRCIRCSATAKRSGGSFICAGVAAMFIFQAFENIGMCIGIMPCTGIPLPFFSYGGSSIITSFLAVGLVLSVYKRRRDI